MNKFNRVVVLVLDSVGIGAMPDAEKYNDDQSVHTIGNIAKTVGLKIPNLEKMGLANIAPIEGVEPAEHPTANYGKMAELADGKDSVTGHWEIMGCTLEKGFNQFVENGFPEELIEEFKRQTGRGVLANKEGSGMKVIKEYFDEHMASGDLIVYTSVDSTFQIAANEDVVPLEELYKACEIARELTKDPKYNVSRVIARPFLGDNKEDFYRTANRHDYALNPPEVTVMQKVEAAGLESVSVGKISDLFSGIGVTSHLKNEDNMHGVDNMIQELKRDYKGMLFVNLVDFDVLFGHPRNVEGYKEAIEDFDARMPEVLENLKEDDLLIITADHGNDPTFRGNDHTREYVPLLVYSKELNGDNDLSTRKTFEDIGATVADNFDLEGTKNGTSFLQELK